MAKHPGPTRRVQGRGIHRRRKNLKQKREVTNVTIEVLTNEEIEMVTESKDKAIATDGDAKGDIQVNTR